MKSSLAILLGFTLAACDSKPPEPLATPFPATPLPTPAKGPAGSTAPDGKNWIYDRTHNGTALDLKPSQKGTPPGGGSTSLEHRPK